MAIDGDPRTALEHDSARVTVPRNTDAALSLTRVLTPAVDLVMALLGALVAARAGVVGVVYVALAATAVVASGAYRPRIVPSVGNALPSLVAQLALPVALIGPFVAGSDAADALLRAVPVVIVLVVVGRLLSSSAIRRARSSGLVVEPTLIVGAGELGLSVATTLQEHPEYGMVAVGFLADCATPPRVPVLGTIADLDRVVREFGIRRAIVAFGPTKDVNLVDVIRACEVNHVEVHVVPRFFELGMAPEGLGSDDIWGIPLVHLRRSALRTTAWRTKRLFDVVVASVMLMLGAPVMIAIAVVLKLTSRGPVLFRQPRIGQRGRVVGVLKFRTLPVNVDADTTWNVANDERLTPVGRFLRRTSLDELPQLFNVLKGDMSLVGPRPERPYFVVQFSETVRRYSDRHRVPVGLTGWAQVHNLRGDTSIEERARFDNFYIEHWSLWRDVVILAKTFRALLGGEDR